VTQHRVVFTPSGLDAVVESGTTVLDAARRVGVDLDSVCGGRGICGRCQVTPSIGSFPKWSIDATATSLSDLGAAEIDYRGKRPLAPGNRLGCMAQVCGDVVVDVPASSQVHRQVVRKDLDLGDVRIDPFYVVLYVEVEPSSLGDSTTACDAIASAIAEQHRRPRPTFAPHVLAEVHRAIERCSGGATVALRWSGDEIVAVWPGFVESVYGVAIDVGSTTVAGHLLDLATGERMASAGRMNPQIRFGEDLMSRVSYAMMNPGGAAQMTDAVRAALSALAAEVAAEAGATPQDILEMTLVGNPIMHHLVLGLDPVELGGAPFALAIDQAIEQRAESLGLNLHPGARVYVLPCIAGHVGADTAGMILAERPDLGDPITLLVDVGTNAEIVLGNRQRLLACSSPTGPAFEGAQISCGQRAAPGAIERVRIDPETLEPRFRVIGCDLWSDDPGFAAATADIGVTGICGSGIIEVIAEMYLAGVINQDGVVDGQLAARSPRIVPADRTFSYVLHRGAVTLCITQTDVRAIQLAKAALYAGVRLLMEALGVERVDRIRLAGAFGAHIDTRYAMVLGMIPDCDLAQVSAAGNSAGTGARIALLEARSRGTIEAVVRRVEKIETAIEPRFQEHFVDAMAIPHKHFANPELAKVVTLPPPRESATQAAAARSRRSRRPA